MGLRPGRFRSAYGGDTVQAPGGPRDGKEALYGQAEVPDYFQANGGFAVGGGPGGGVLGRQAPGVRGEGVSLGVEGLRGAEPAQRQVKAFDTRAARGAHGGRGARRRS